MQTGGGITRKRRRMQRLLYWVMALLGTYILGKGGGFVLDRPAVQEAMARQEAKRRLEDMVIRTLMPGYTAAVQGWTVNWMAWLLEPTLPVYGYLASQTMQEKGETGTDASVVSAGHCSRCRFCQLLPLAYLHIRHRNVLARIIEL